MAARPVFAALDNVPLPVPTLATLHRAEQDLPTVTAYPPTADELANARRVASEYRHAAEVYNPVAREWPARRASVVACADRLSLIELASGVPAEPVGRRALRRRRREPCCHAVLHGDPWRRTSRRSCTRPAWTHLSRNAVCVACSNSLNSRRDGRTLLTCPRATAAGIGGPFLILASALDGINEDLRGIREDLRGVKEDVKTINNNVWTLRPR